MEANSNECHHGEKSCVLETHKAAAKVETVVQIALLGYQDQSHALHPHHIGADPDTWSHNLGTHDTSSVAAVDQSPFVVYLMCTWSCRELVWNEKAHIEMI